MKLYITEILKEANEFGMSQINVAPTSPASPTPEMSGLTGPNVSSPTEMNSQLMMNPQQGTGGMMLPGQPGQLNLSELLKTPGFRPTT